MSMRRFERRTDPGRAASARYRSRSLRLDNEQIRLEKAGLVVAMGLAGVSLSSVAAFALAGIDSTLSILLPLVFLGWMFLIADALQD